MLQVAAAAMVVLSLLLGASVGALAQHEGAVGSAPVSTSIEFDECDPYGRSEVCYAVVQVPLDYSDPDGATVDLSVIRHAAKGERIGTLFIDPGGTSVILGSLFQKLIGVEPLADHFDLLQIFPRDIHLCELEEADLPERSSLDDALSDDIDAYLAHFRAMAAACWRENGADFLASLTTENAARDIERIRQLLGEERISFLGKGYATAIGWVHASLFPDAVRSMVLDSAIVDDPTLGDSESRAKAYEAHLQRLDRSCAAWEGCPVSDIGFLSAIAAVRDELSRHGAIGALDEPSFEAALDALYASPWEFREVAPGLAIALDDEDSLTDDQPIAYLGVPDGAVGSREAVICADGSPFAGTSTDLHDEVERTSALAPDAGPVWSVPCDLWPVSGSGIPAVDYTGSAPIVVVGNSYDAITPHAWSVALAEELGPNATLLTWDGSGHAVALEGVDQCLDEQLLAFLIDGVVPEPGAVCPQRGFLGVRMDYTVTPNLISAVTPGGAADAAGIEVGDIVLEADGRPVETGMDVPEGPIGQNLDLKLQRGDEIVELSIVRRPPVWELWRIADDPGLSEVTE